MPSLTLAIDTSASACAVALLDGGTVLAEGREAMVHGHAAALVPMVMAVVGGAGAAVGDVATIGVAVGPGSFAGIRTGIAAAHGFALASEARAVGVSTFEAVARGALARAGGGGGVMCVLDTRREDYFVQEFGPGCRPASRPAALDGAAVARRLGEARLALAGNAVDRLLEGFPGLDRGAASGGDLPHAADVARLAAQMVEEGRAAAPVPLYLRAPSTTRRKR